MGFRCAFLKLNDVPLIGNVQNVGIILDPPHMLKNVRNMFGTHKVFFDKNSREINFYYLELLVEVQIGIQLGNKVKSTHIVFKDQKMKVSLATELLSKSTVNALSFLKDEIKVDAFKGASPTIELVKNINNCFDILNSRGHSNNVYKQPITAANLRFFLKLL